MENVRDTRFASQRRARPVERAQAQRALSIDHDELEVLDKTARSAEIDHDIEGREVRAELRRGVSREFVSGVRRPWSGCAELPSAHHEDFLRSL